MLYKAFLHTADVFAHVSPHCSICQWFPQPGNVWDIPSIRPGRAAAGKQDKATALYYSIRKIYIATIYILSDRRMEVPKRLLDQFCLKPGKSLVSRFYPSTATGWCVKHTNWCVRTQRTVMTERCWKLILNFPAETQNPKILKARSQKIQVTDKYRRAPNTLFA